MIFGRQNEESPKDLISPNRVAFQDRTTLQVRMSGRP